jgi:hypothetical protein
MVACGSPTRHAGDDTIEVDALSNCNMEGAQRCEGATFQTCTGGTWQSAVDCPQQCLDGLGCVQCTPGQSFCKDGNVWSCDDVGNPLAEVQACTGQNTCVGGSCVDACLDAAASKSYIGCEYWAADLDNAIEVWGVMNQPLGQGFTLTPNYCSMVYSGTIATMDVCYEVSGGGPNAKILGHGLCDPPATAGGAPRCPAGSTCGSQSVCVSDAQHSPFAIVVSNPQAKDVTVTLTGPGGQVSTQVIPAGQVNAIKPQTASTPIPDQSIDGSTKAKRGYKITADLPIVAYQFNPLDNVNVFSNDASLLIPSTVFDQDYYVMTMPSLDRRTGQTLANTSNSYYGYLAVISPADGTQVQVTPTVPTSASAINATIAAGTPTTFTLDAFEVLQLQADGAGDLTGTHITSPNMMPFGVFGGHEATLFGETSPPDANHARGPCCADHLEEMMFPSSTWGKEFAIARSQSRMTNERDLIRVLAQKPGTTVTFTPPPASGTCSTLNAGQFCEVKIFGDTEISSNEPILVGHFLQSAIWGYTGPGMGSSIGTGDPSMAISAPTEQFRKEYTFLVPAQYEANYVSIAAPATGGITLDGAPVTMAAFPGGGTHRGARVLLTAGQHKITCADGCGITVYGWSARGVSYMFAGGLDLKPIVIF